MEQKKVLFYGAGQHGAMLYRHAARKSASYGEPAAFIDRDVYKQGHDFFGLPVISWTDAQKQYGNDFYIYVTGNEKAAPEIMGFLLEEGVSPDRIINYEPVEKRLGCPIAESFFIVGPSKNTIAYGACSKPAENLSYDLGCGRGGVYDYRIASQSDVLLEAVNNVHRLAQTLADGDLENIHDGCINKKIRYCFQNRKIRSLNYSGYGPCNFKCSYCLYGHPNYDLEPVHFNGLYSIIGDVLQNLEALHIMNEDTTIKMSCGEFSINEEGRRLAELSGKYPTTFYTNAYIYTLEAARAIENSGIIYSSLDSGTAMTFQRIKGVDGYERVTENLREYSKHGPVALKYILMDGVNDSWKDLEGFFALADEISVRVDLTRDFMDTKSVFSDHTLEFAAQFIKHFRDMGRLNMSQASFTRPGEKERLNKLLEEI